MPLGPVRTGIVFLAVVSELGLVEELVDRVVSSNVVDVVVWLALDR